MKHANQAIEAMTRIDESMLVVTHTPQLNKDKRIVMDALRALDAIEQRADQIGLARQLTVAADEIQQCADDEGIEGT